MKNFTEKNRRISVLTGNFSELVRAFISLYGAILMQFDGLKSRKLANFASLLAEDSPCVKQAINWQGCKVGKVLFQVHFPYKKTWSSRI
jgi:hypothetical protein